ncbi:MAG TPA: histidine kinase dimerization/phospho-acceptor domain-containing protein, partial [Terriglobales bacterium]|nr:histidine kinase dimerization/phospho-acceptor domain-containing protein [Terriglobales bacterium]
MSDRIKVWVAVLVCLVLVQAAVSLFLPGRSFALTACSDIVQCLTLLAASLSCVPNLMRTRGRSRLFWALMGLGFASWLTYQVLWSYIEVVQRQEVPDLFTGDVVLFLHIVPMMAALALQPSIKQENRDLRLSSLDFALLLLWWVYLYFYSVSVWLYVYPDLPAYNRNLNQAYLVEKLAFLAGITLLWSRSRGQWKVIWAHWFGASVLYSSSSYVANWALARHIYYSGSLYDLPLIASTAWMSVPGLLALKLPSEEAVETQAQPRGVWTARLGMLAVFSLPIFASIAYFQASLPPEVSSYRLVLTLAAMVLMGGLVFLKQHLLDVELIGLLRSSQKSFQDLQRLQAQLVQSEKLASLGQLVGGAAHELNNPLTAMLGYSELLAITQLTTEQRALSEKIAHQAKRIRALITSLLSFAKQTPSEKTALDINIILKTALKLCQPQLLAAGAQYSTALAESLSPVRGDSNQL